MYFQDIIFELNRYWAEQGCVVMQPYDMEVGAGTFHPATLLRALGPQPWKAAYVQPSRRPTDGRYGENPNRMQMHTQFQVIIQPDPGNPQELYLNSLRAIGIDLGTLTTMTLSDGWQADNPRHLEKHKDQMKRLAIGTLRRIQKLPELVQSFFKQPECQYIVA